MHLNRPTIASLLPLMVVPALAACGSNDHVPGSSADEATRGKEASVAASLTTAPNYPLSIGQTGRYLVDQDGTPFFLVGDAAWSLIAQLSQADAVDYLDDRQGRGFNGLLVSLVEHEFASNPPLNQYGDAPFNGRPFTNFDSSYFAHADEVISAAEERGILVFLFPAYLGWECGSQGWCSEVRAATTSEMRAWGQFVGERYRNFDNIVWVVGGDTNPPSDVKPKLAAMVEGIREFDTRHLITSHNAPNTRARQVWPSSSYPWHELDNVYTGDITYDLSKTAYEATPAAPFFNIEAYYENEHGMTAQRLRAQMYWTVLSGGFGHVFGNCPIWHFGSSNSWCGAVNWRQALGSEGAQGMTYAKRLFTSRRWHLLEPDFTHEVLTGGYGSWGSSSYVTAASASDGSSVIAYLPSRSRVTIDMSKVSGSTANVWWYEPATGESTLAGTFSTSGSRRLRPSSYTDWVLVIDDASLDFPAPGSESVDDPPPEPPPDPSNEAPTVATAARAEPGSVTASQTSLSVLGSDDGGESALTYTWSTTGNPPGLAEFSPNGTNASKQSTATFDNVGTYALRVTIRDSEGATTQSDVSVPVVATASRISVAPSSATVLTGASQSFSGTVFDQFDDPMQGVSFAWSVSGGGTISSSGLFSAGNTPGGPFDILAAAQGMTGTASVTISTAAPADTFIDFESFGDGTVLTSQGGISWGGSPRWGVWDGSSYRGGYTKNAYVNSTSKGEVTATFTLPSATVLKSLRLATPSGATSSVAFSSPGNPDRVYSGIGSSYVTKNLDWQVASAQVTVRINCTSQWGASDVAFDNLTYGAP